MARLTLNKIKFDMGDKENVLRGSKINENIDKNCFHTTTKVHLATDFKIMILDPNLY